jgi:ethanolamine permease
LRRLVFVLWTDNRYPIRLCCANQEKISDRLLTCEPVAINVLAIARSEIGAWGREAQVSESKRRTRQGIEYEDVGHDYMEQRQLQQGAAGWVLLAGLGVAYVISGDFAGWNFGLAEGGWGGLLIATVLMATMYTAMVFGLAELSSTIPTAGGGYGFARRAMGPWGGFLTGTAILIEYAIAPAAIATFI